MSILFGSVGTRVRFLAWLRAVSGMVCEGTGLESNSSLLSQIHVKPTCGALKPRTLGREVPGSSHPVAVCCGLEQVTYPQLLR